MTAHKGPTGFLGTKWGDDPAECATKLNLTIDRWNPWVDPAFETGIDPDHPRMLLGANGVITLVRGPDKQLVGMQVIYRDCAKDDAQKRALVDAIRRELHVKVSNADLPYEVWPDHSLVHLAARRDGTCMLTVAGPVFGKPYADQALREGLGDVGGAMTPH